ncbi:hypothetical protein FHX44_11419 [Pseudonocardia hierapolitana]|uniref:Uncharacterized protein n=1 Tax=Pseudonocardia hierapolitana TaxID=1128676 RepID=A0A561SI16_9PSEU|nr:hypothetical protein [Pseudonocardia hierapolitana]TWF74538.1 hypothetical protein FHX44_11419 [Pseudonocardia hierapolitana]
MTGDWTPASRARLALAFEACELSDLARAVVAIGEDELRTDGATGSPGAALADAVGVLAAAHRILEAAVVFERAAGAGWPLVGEVMGVPAAEAQERFAGAEARFRERLRSAEEDSAAGAPGEMRWWRAHLVREPREAAQDLDDWALRHADRDDLGAAPVSGRLARFDPGC